uniref:C2H2-type domain-containing protein n=1 Tax=Chelonoidis abingdonii TaxID=106734 RepID=A0A8C0GCZ1_CHEAB
MTNGNEDLEVDITTCEVEAKLEQLNGTKLGAPDNLHLRILKELAHEIAIVFMSLAMLKAHIHEKHCEVFHKCSFCPMAFKSADSTTAHITRQHPEEVIYKCSCETVFNKKKLLQEHFQQNANKLLVGVFKCPQCQLVYMQKQQLMQHVKVGKFISLSSKPDNTPLFLSVANGTSHTTLPRKDTRVEHNTESKPILKSVGWTCRECSQWNPDRENYVSHMKKIHGKSVKRYPCRQCEHSFNDFSSLGRHIRNNHDTAKKVYTCWFCTDENQTFSQPSMLENHISLMHGIKNPDLSQMSKAKAPECDSTKAKSPKRVSADALGQMATTEAPPAKKLKTHWKCAKCGFATDISTEFQEHIPQHKADNSTSQCLLCGLCYTSHISLNRHLFIVHKVKDPLQTDTNENGHEEYNRETNTTVEEENSLKCKMCKSDSVLCAHSQRCGLEDSSSSSQNNHSNATKI